jgi:hypothetical protein
METGLHFAQMALIDDDQMIQAIPSDRSDQEKPRRVPTAGLSWDALTRK